MTAPIIAICGAKRSGKDTLATLIANKWGYKHVKIASKLKEVCRILFNFTDNELETDVKDSMNDKWGISPRKAMQFIGTEVMQYKIQELLPNISRSFWINSLIDSLDINGKNKYVISDLRFLHEYQELKKRGAIIIRIDDHKNANLDSHISEKEYLTIPTDIIIDNSEKNMDKLQNDLDVFFRSWWTSARSKAH